jgi:hypothetical protein
MINMETDKMPEDEGRSPSMQVLSLGELGERPVEHRGFPLGVGGEELRNGRVFVL